MAQCRTVVLNCFQKKVTYASVHVHIFYVFLFHPILYDLYIYF